MAARKRKPKKSQYGLKPPRMRPIRRDQIEAIRAKARRSPTDKLEVIWSAFHGDQTAHFVLLEMYLQSLKRDRGGSADCFLRTFACVDLHYQRTTRGRPWPEWWPWEDPTVLELGSLAITPDDYITAEVMVAATVQ